MHETNAMWRVVGDFKYGSRGVGGVLMMSMGRMRWIYGKNHEGLGEKSKIRF